MKNHKLAIIIAIILFIIPFFWLKPGEMNLGGDSGRLYFYDPYSFLKNFTLYNFLASGKGVESISYVFSSYTYILFLLKFIFQSPTVLIGISNGLILSVGFLSIYFIVQELIGTREFALKKEIINYSSILAGLFYIFSQELMNGGWANPLITHNQLFLNPFMFLLILKYLLTKNNLYIVVALLTSVFFAANFSYVGAPTFFAFYPLSLVFLFCYIKYIRKITIPFKGICYGVLLFLLLHAFHLFPELSAVFSFNSAVSKTVFSVDGEFSRSGLDYFISVASNTKVSPSWMSLNQSQNGPVFAMFIVMPLILIGGFYLNKGRTLLLTGIFFLIVLFFSTANITDIGLYFYKLLFKLPGFSMFRNFHGQLIYIFVFFNTLLFSQAIAIIVNRLRLRNALIIIGAFCIFILAFSTPFLDGSIPVPTYKESGLRYAFRMDPVYEKVLNFYKTDSIDGKTISFPLTGPGYQVLQGVDGFVYQGLPIISYVAGKSDFAGFGSFYPYDEIFLEYIKKQDYSAIENLFSIMNIKYIFYNSDPFIYSNVFKNYLYAHVSDYNPKTQEQYKSFIEHLPVTAHPIDFGNKYHIYTINSDQFLPHIFTTTDIAYTNDQLSFTISPYVNGEVRTVPVSIEDTTNKDNVVLFGTPQTFLSELTKNLHFHRHGPHISHSPNSIFYPAVLLKERYNLYRLRNNHFVYFDTNLLILTKRISELLGFWKNMQVIKRPWQEPKIWEFYRLGAYNSWEASLARYEKGVEELIDWVENSNEPIANQEANRIKINEQLYQHEISLLKAIRNMNMKNTDKKYIYSLSDDMFERLFQKVNIPLYNPSQYYYDLPDYPGNYSVSLQRKDLDLDLTDASIVVNNKVLKPLSSTSGKIFSSNFLPFDNYSFNPNTDTRFVLNVPAKNLVKDAQWSNSGEAIKTNELLTLTVNNNIGENTQGLMLNIPNWTPKNTYIINFDYLTQGDDFIFSFLDKAASPDDLNKHGYKLFFEKILNSKTWKTHQSIVNSEGGSLAAFLKISAFSTKDISKMHIKNLSVTKIQYPTIIFKKITNGLGEEDKRPKITFTKINPTKYSIKVENANHQYALVFLESFNSNWVLIDTTREDMTIMSSILRTAGAVGKYIVGAFIKETGITNQSIATYFNGQVKEGVHENRFLAPSTFETWGKRLIAQDKHSNTFEYANVWIVDPEDMGEKKDYTLILEMQTQRYFYPSLLISLITITGVITFTVIRLIHGKNP